MNISTSQFNATPTSSIELGINIPADATTAGAPSDPYMLPVEYFDNLGRAQTVTFQFTPTVPASGSSNAWNVEIFDSAGNPATSVGDLALTFNDTPTSGGRINTATATNGAT